MIEAGVTRRIRVVHAAYAQDWLTLPLKLRTQAAGGEPILFARGAIRGSCRLESMTHSLARFVTGLELRCGGLRDRDLSPLLASVLSLLGWTTTRHGLAGSGGARALCGRKQVRGPPHSQKFE